MTKPTLTQECFDVASMMKWSMSAGPQEIRPIDMNHIATLLTKAAREIEHLRSENRLLSLKIDDLERHDG